MLRRNQKRFLGFFPLLFRNVLQKLAHPAWVRPNPSEFLFGIRRVDILELDGE